MYAVVTVVATGGLDTGSCELCIDCFSLNSVEHR